MANLSLNENEWKAYLPFLQQELQGRYLASPLLYAKDTFFFRLSNAKYRRLVLSLNGDFPRIYLTDESLEGHSLDGKSVDSLRKELANVFVESVDLVPNDRILKIVYTRINDVYKEEKHILYAEMIPHHPNLVLTNESGTILYVFRPSGLETKRPLGKGLRYELPETPGNVVTPTISFDCMEFLSRCHSAETLLTESRKKEKYAPLFQALKQREKRLTRKIEKLQQDYDEASTHLQDGQKGDAIYTSWGELSPKQTSFVYEGQTIMLDPAKTLAQNAETYYRRAKKAKETLQQSQHFLTLAKEEQETLQTTLAALPQADESALDELSKQLHISSKQSNAKKQASSTSLFSHDLLPYEIEKDGVRIVFGKSAKQNSFLSFVYDTAPTHLWFHILGRSGSHVMIKTEHPTDDLIRTAAEICLYESKESDGDVMMTERKNVRAGRTPGEAIVKSYETIHLKNVSPETKRLCDNATKVKAPR